MDFETFAKQNGITLESKYVDLEPMEYETYGSTQKYYQFHWLCTLTVTASNRTRVHVAEYSAGEGHARKFEDDEKMRAQRYAKKIKSVCVDHPRYSPGHRAPLWVPTPPTVGSLLGCLQSDSSAGQHLLYEDFCGDFGYEEDSRKGEKVWRRCQEVCGRMQHFLGAEFDAFMECQEE